MNILILTGSFGSGHLSAANAVKEEFEEIYTDADVTVLDIFSYMLPLISRPVYWGYNIIAGRHHRLYNRIDLVDRPRGAAFLHRLFNRKFNGLIDRYRPDLLVSTWPIGAEYVGNYIEKTGSRTPYITFITDIKNSRGWVSESADAYIVGDDITREGLLSLGVAADRIFIGGIPVSKVFKPAAGRQQAADAGSIPAPEGRSSGTEDVSTGAEARNCVRGRGSAPEGSTAKRPREVLLMGGGLGLIPYAQPILDCLERMPGVHTTVITGSNARLCKKLQRRYKEAAVIGYCREVDRYMKKADLLISKAGGVTLFEAIYSSTPILVIDPQLVHEKTNAEYIREKGIGEVLCTDSGSPLSKLEALLTDDTALAEMQRRMGDIREALSGHGLKQVLDEMAAKPGQTRQPDLKNRP